MSSQEHDNDGNTASNNQHDHGDERTRDTAADSASTASSGHPGAAPASDGEPASTTERPGTTGATATSNNASTGSNASTGNNASTGSNTSTGNRASIGSSGSAATGARATDPHARRTPDGASGGTPPAGGGSGRGGRRGPLLAVLAIILLIVIVAAVWGGVLLRQQRQSIAALQDRVQSLSQQSQQFESGQQRVSQLQQSVSRLQGRLSQTHQTMQRVMQELSRQQQTDSRQWLYAEVEYLLRMANQRLQLERDVSSAKTLLSAADDRLREADNPALTPVRRAISSELAALNGVPDIDRTGLYLQFGALEEQIAQLPLSQEVKALSAAPADESTFSGDWRSQLVRLGNQLKDLVTVRRHDEPLQALVTPDQEGYLRQNIRLLLEQAQLALLKSNEKVYRQSIARASDLIESWFKRDDSATQNLLQQLDELSGRNIHPQLPDISGSVNAIRQFQQQQQSSGEQGVSS